MNVIFNRRKLLDDLACLQTVASAKSTQPILSHIHLCPKTNIVRLTATDLTSLMRIDAECEKLEGGKPWTLSARKLFDICKSSTDETVEIASQEGDWFSVKCGRARFRLMALDSRSFPTWECDKDVRATISLPATALAALLDRTLFCVSSDDARYNLAGIYVETPKPGTLRFVATDGHRLAYADELIEGVSISKPVILPRAGLSELRKLLDRAEKDTSVTLTIRGDVADVRVTENLFFSMRLVEGQFPAYQDVIPKPQHELMFDREALIGALRRGSLFAESRLSGVKLSVEPNLLTLSSSSAESGESSETLDSNYSGAPFSVGFNSHYLMQALNAAPEDMEVAIGLTDETTPATISAPTESGWCCVIMPMRVL